MQKRNEKKSNCVERLSFMTKDMKSEKKMTVRECLTMGLSFLVV